MIQINLAKSKQNPRKEKSDETQYSTADYKTPTTNRYDDNKRVSDP